MRFVILASILIVISSACVPQKEYLEQQETLNYYKERALAADSVDIASRKSNEDKLLMETQLEETTHDLEQLTATNISLNKSYQEVLQKYNALINQNRDVLNVSSYEKVALQEQLASQQSKLDQRERDLALAEKSLYDKETQLKVMEYNMTEKGGTPTNYDQAEDNWRCKQIEQALTRQQQQLTGLRNALTAGLSSYSSTDISIVESKGKLIVNLTQPFLFGTTSADITYSGAEALRKIAEAFKLYDGLNLMVESHTSADGTAARNWDLSATRATTVVKQLADFGAAPEHLSATGRGYFSPIATNATQQGKIQNMRTVLIFTTATDEVLNLMR